MEQVHLNYTAMRMLCVFLKYCENIETHLADKFCVIIIFLHIKKEMKFHPEALSDGSSS